MLRILVNVSAPLYDNSLLQYAIQLCKAKKCSIYIYHQFISPVPIVSGRFVNSYLPLELMNASKGILENLCIQLQVEYDIVAKCNIDLFPLTQLLKDEAFRNQFDILIVSVWKPFMKFDSLSRYLSRKYSDPYIPTLYVPNARKYTEIKLVFSISEETHFQVGQLSTLPELFFKSDCSKIEVISPKKVKLLGKKSFFGRQVISNAIHFGRNASAISYSTDRDNSYELGEPDLIILRCKTSVSDVTQLVHNKSPIFFPILTN